MKFTLHDELLQTLVGNEIYSDPFTFLREAVQNAVDACYLREAAEAGPYERDVVVSYSPTHRTVEVRDNGLGMDGEAVEDGFASVGAPKAAVGHVADLLRKYPDLATNQIGRFGLGVLSYFMAGESVIVESQRAGRPPVRYRIDGPAAQFISEPPDGTLGVGTTVLITLKPGVDIAGVPGALRRFARHVRGLRLRNADTGAEEVVYTPYASGEAPGVARTLSHPALLGGSLALHPSVTGKREAGAVVVKAQAAVSNGGFLVKDHLPALLPFPCFGYSADIDLRPGALRVFLDREDVRQDAAFRDLSQYLVLQWAELMEQWLRLARTGSRAPATDAHLVYQVLGHGGSQVQPVAAAFERLKAAALDAAVFSVGEDRRVDRTGLVGLVNDSAARGLPRTLFVDDEGQGTQHQKQTAYESSRLVFTDDVSFGKRYRKGRLRAKGYVVVTTQWQQYAVEREQGTLTLNVTEGQVLQQVAGAVGISVRPLSQATAEELSVGGGDVAELVENLVELEGLRLVHLPGLTDGFAGDYDGRLLNLANEGSRALLRAWPRLQTNPVLRELFHLYVDMVTFRMKDAETRLRKLLLDETLADRLQVSAGALQRGFLEEMIEDLIAQTAGGRAEPTERAEVRR